MPPPRLLGLSDWVWILAGSVAAVAHLLLKLQGL
jgi:hypothetical protein